MGRGNSAHKNTDSRVDNVAVCVVAKACPPPPSVQGEPWSRASAGLCVCVCESPPRAPCSSCTFPLQITVLAITASFFSSQSWVRHPRAQPTAAC